MNEDLDLNAEGQGSEDQGTAEGALGAPDLLDDQGTETSDDESGVQSDEEDAVDPFDPFDEATKALLYQDPERGIQALNERWKKSELGRKKAFTKRMQRLSEKENEANTWKKQAEDFFAKAKEVDPAAFERVMAAGMGKAPAGKSGGWLDGVKSKADLEAVLEDRLRSLESTLLDKYQGDQVTKQVDSFLQRNGSFRSHREKIVELCRTTGLSPLNAAAAVDPHLVAKLARDSARKAEPGGDIGVNEMSAPRKVRYNSLEEAFEHAFANPRAVTSE